MAVAQSLDWISAEDYLQAEQDGQVRHEYISGIVRRPPYVVRKRILALP